MDIEHTSCTRILIFFSGSIDEWGCYTRRVEVDLRVFNCITYYNNAVALAWRSPSHRPLNAFTLRVSGSGPVSLALIANTNFWLSFLANVSLMHLTPECPDQQNLISLWGVASWCLELFWKRRITTFNRWWLFFKLFESTLRKRISW